MFHIRRAMSCGSSALLALALLLPVPPAHAGPTEATGTGLRHSTIQPSIALQYLVRVRGPKQRLGDVILFAGDFVPDEFAPADGQMRSVEKEPVLFQAIGTAFGGDGTTTFALPDLRGRVPVGRGRGPGLTNRPLGTAFGSDIVLLSPSNLPRHRHQSNPESAQPGAQAALTGYTGEATAFSNVQPSLAMNYMISTVGTWPTGSRSGYAWIGEVRLTARAAAPPGWMLLEGQPVVLKKFGPLAALLGVHEEKAKTAFNLPDLRGRAVLGANLGTTGRQLPILGLAGEESFRMRLEDMPTHFHALGTNGSLRTSLAGGEHPLDNLQPSVSLEYRLCVSDGLYPTRGGGSSDDPEPPADLADPADSGNLETEALWGQLILVVTSMTGEERGWFRAHGATLSVNGNSALFSLLGTTYGGDVTKGIFSLPDLRGRVVVGAGQGTAGAWRLGEQRGSDQITLTEKEMPRHAHEEDGGAEPEGSGK